MSQSSKRALAWVLPFALLLAAIFASSVARADLPAVRVAEVFDTAVSADTNLLSDDVQMAGSLDSCAYRLTIGLVSTDTVVNVTVTSGATTRTFALNNNAAIPAGRLYSFAFGASKTFSYNLQCSDATTVGYLLLEQIRDGNL